MESFKGLIDWLFERKPAGTVAQIGVADERKVGLCWWPGKNLKSASYRPDPLRVRYYGCTNRAYASPFLPMSEQVAHIITHMIDIDGHDNPHLPFNSLIDRVTRVVGPMGSIRTSCGGSGLHVIFRLQEPMFYDPAQARSVLTQCTQQLSQPWVDQLKDEGVKVCKYDSRMFWLVGGLNRWIYKSYQLVPPSISRNIMLQNFKLGDTDALWSKNGALSASDTQELGPFVTEWLTKLATRPGPVYVGYVVEQLRKNGEQVSTKSPCSGNGQVNGYIDCGPGWISLWSYADGHAIWKEVDMDSLLETKEEV